MRRIARLGALLALSTAVAAFVLACGGAGDEPATSTMSAGTPEVVGPSAASRPPPAAAAAGGAGVALGIGSYCWGGVCADSIGVVVRPPPLSVARGATVRIANPAPGSPIKDAKVQAWPQTGAPLASSRGEEVWGVQGIGARVAAAASPSTVGFAANLAPGRYVVTIFVAFARGDVSYGLLLEVVP